MEGGGRSDPGDQAAPPKTRSPLHLEQLLQEVKGNNTLWLTLRGTPPPPPPPPARAAPTSPNLSAQPARLAGARSAGHCGAEQIGFPAPRPHVTPTPLPNPGLSMFCCERANRPAQGEKLFTEEFVKSPSPSPRSAPLEPPPINPPAARKVSCRSRAGRCAEPSRSAAGSGPATWTPLICCICPPRAAVPSAALPARAAAAVATAAAWSERAEEGIPPRPFPVWSPSREAPRPPRTRRPNLSVPSRGALGSPR